jgi:hypothetical protein
MILTSPKDSHDAAQSEDQSGRTDRGGQRLEIIRQATHICLLMRRLEGSKLASAVAASLNADRVCQLRSPP